MLALKYKVGDKVRVKSKEWYYNKYLADNGKYLYNIVKSMKPFLGQVLTISKTIIDDRYYHVEGNDYK
jgi:hypothetical protein